MCRDISHPVGTQNQDQRRHLGVVGEQLDEAFPFGLVVAQGEQLLGLVDHQRSGLAAGPGRGQGPDGVPSWGDEVAVLPLAGQRRDDAGTNQRRLPAPGRAEDGEDALGLETLVGESDVAVAAEEALVVVDVVGHEAQVGAGVAGALPGFRGVEVGVLAEDGPLELSERWARVDAELVDEAAPDVGDGAQGFALPAGAILGQGQQLPPAFPQWSGVGQCLGLGEDLAVTAGLDGGFEPPFLGVEVELGQAGRLEAAGLPVFELGVGASAPQGERLAQNVRGTVGLTELEELVAAGGQRFEPAGVDIVDGEGEPVAVAGGLDGLGTEDLAEPDDTGLQVLVPGRWGCVAPDHLGELVSAERLVAGHCEGGKDECLPRAQARRRVVEPQGS